MNIVDNKIILIKYYYKVIFLYSRLLLLGCLLFE